MNRGNIKGAVMPVISYASGKGGSCKTTSVLSVGVELAMKGGQVAVMDCDPNQHAAKFYKLFRKVQAPTGDSKRNKNAPVELSGGGSFHILPDVTEKNFASALREAQGAAAFVLLDLPGVDSKLNLIAQLNSDLVVIPLQPSRMDLDDAFRAADDVDHASTPNRYVESRFLLARWPVLGETRTTKHVRKQLEKRGDRNRSFSVPLFERTIFKEMTFSGKTPGMIDPDSNAAMNISAMTTELLQTLDDMNNRHEAVA
jgi:chromosome partitioning protein